MSVERIGPDMLRLSGRCSSNDAETLLAALLETPDARVDWRDCDSAHTAVIQILMASQVALEGPPRGAFLATHVAPLSSLGGDEAPRPRA